MLAGGCQRHGGQEPYAPLLEALDRFVQGRSAAQRQIDLEGCAWLARLLPELAEAGTAPLPLWTPPPEQERRLMFKAVVRLLTNVAGPGGTLLVLDDLQWAGADALDLLATLTRAAPEARLLVLGAYRDMEVRPEDPLALLLADLAHAGLVARHMLAPLAREEATALLDCLLEGTATEGEPALREQVLRRTGGVPYFLVSCAQAIRLRTHADGPEDVIPWDVALAVRQRVAMLPKAARAVLNAAAVVGRVVPRAVLLAVAAGAQEEVLAGLEAAGGARLLVEDGQQGYQFAHDIIREVVEADLSTARRAALHRQVAEALEAAPGEPPLAALAYHYAHSDAQDKAVLYLERAGDQARERFANRAAEEHYRELVERLDRLQRDLEAAHAREKLGTVLWVLGQYATALPVLRRTAETYRVLGDVESLARATALIAEVYTISGASHEGLRYLRPVLETLSATSPSRGLAGLYGALARLLFPIGHYREQLEAAERAEDLARTVQDEWLLAEATWMQGMGFLALGHDEDGRHALESPTRGQQGRASNKHANQPRRRSA